jgi:NCAIR mutase (PurE)-related protein
MREELIRVLNMVKENKIEVEEAADLIEAFFDTEVKEVKNNNTKRKLVIKVNSADGDKVNVRIPLGLIKMAKAMIPLGLSQQGTNMSKEQIDQIIEAIDNINFDEFEGETIVDVDSEDGDIVKIYIE